VNNFCQKKKKQVSNYPERDKTNSVMWMARVGVVCGGESPVPQKRST